VPWLSILIVVVVASLAAVYLVLRARKPQLPPENEQVRALTGKLMELLAKEEYDTIVDRYCKPDTKYYDEVHDLLNQIVRGDSGSHGLNIFRTRCMQVDEKDRLQEAERFVREFGGEDIEYVVVVLAQLTFPDGELRSELGGTLAGSARTDTFLAWYLRNTFFAMDFTDAEVTEVGWKEGPRGDMLMVATMSYVEPVEPRPSLPDPNFIPWRRLGEGKWALAITNQHLLREVLDVLGRAKIP